MPRSGQVVFAASTKELTGLILADSAKGSQHLDSGAATPLCGSVLHGASEASVVEAPGVEPLKPINRDDDLHDPRAV